MSVAYKGDDNLMKALLAAGETRPLHIIKRIMNGVVAAPDDLSDDYAFTKLFRIKEDKEAREQLLALKNDLRAKPPVAPPRSIMSQLHAQLKIENVYGFYIPRGDEYRGEYVPARSERLAWLTGFTGSAGSAIVLRDRAAFFTDGRYTLQAAAEVDGKQFEIINTSDETQPKPMEWLLQHLPRFSKFLIDPWLHSISEVNQLHKKLTETDRYLNIQENFNLLDQIWPHHPPEPLTPVVPHPVEFAGESTVSKMKTLSAAMAFNKVDAMVLTLPEEICWLLNIRGNDVPNTPFVLSYAVVHKDGDVHWFVHSDKVTPETRDWLSGIAMIRDQNFGSPNAFKNHLKEIVSQGKKLWVDPDSAPFAVENTILNASKPEDFAPNAKKAPKEVLKAERIHYEKSPIQRLKAMKNKPEIEGAINAHLRDGIAVTRFLAAMAEQGAAAKYDEMSAADLLLQYRKENDLFRGLSFDTIAGSGANGAVIHYRSAPATNKPLTNSPMFLVDSGAQYQDGTTDITRTISVDTPTTEMRETFTRVLKGHIQISMAVFPEGTAGKDIDYKARAALKEIGLDYAHGTGHGVGSYLSVHEGPQGISERSTYPFEPGMILSNEPGYYKEGEYGIRTENLIVVVDTERKDDQGRRLFAFRTLTMAPYDRNLIDPSLLTDKELNWLNSYHAEVRTEILPLLQRKDPRAAAFLQQATEPIYKSGGVTAPRSAPKM